MATQHAATTVAEPAWANVSVIEALSSLPIIRPTCAMSLPDEYTKAEDLPVFAIARANVVQITASSRVSPTHRPVAAVKRNDEDGIEPP